MKKLFHLCEETLGSGVCHEELSGKDLCEFLGVGSRARAQSHYREPERVAFQNVRLKERWIQFEKDQEFYQIELNQNNVAKFNIQGDERHLFDLPGLNYLGHWSMIIEGIKYEYIAGGHDNAIGYHDGNIHATPFGFYIPHLECNENCILFEPGTKLESISIDFVNGVFSGTQINDDTNNEEPFIHKFELHLDLLPESIATNFLDEAQDMGMLSKNKCESQKKRRQSFKYGVKLPPCKGEEQKVENFKTKKIKK
jgi:hypothetical protein